jgi:hypothetical protein
MRSIPLTQGQSALVDEQDFHTLSCFRWFAQKIEASGGFYAVRNETVNGVKRIVFMHRVINETPVGVMTDHINGDGLDNRRHNLRNVTPRQNQMNRSPNKGGSSCLKGAWYDDSKRNTKKWRSAIRVNGKLKYLGRFNTAEAASQAYAAAAKEHFQQYHCTLRGEI